MKLAQEVPPRVSISILDNCVGQNKSQLMMKFFPLLSVCFYDTVATLYLLPGHSHMMADRATAHAKGALKMENIYHPNDWYSV